VVSVNPYVFIVGCARSGTSLLKRMIDAHSQVAIARESHWIPTYFEARTGLTPAGRVAPSLIDALIANPRFSRMKLTRSDLNRLLEAQKNPSYSEFVSAMFDLYARRRGKEYAGDKTPGYVKQIPALHSLWPQARFVHLIRDGRDVCLSALGWKAAERGPGRFATWADDPVATAALWWEWHVRLGREAAGQLPPGRYHEIRYESLVADPETVCRGLCDFLEIGYEDAVLRPHDRRGPRGAHDSKMAWRPISPGLRDWRSQMQKQDLEVFEALSGDLLIELGYGRGVHSPAPSAVHRAEAVRRSFVSHERALRFGLPERWRHTGPRLPRAEPSRRTPPPDIS
jgi:hypothetical protein